MCTQPAAHFHTSYKAINNHTIYQHLAISTVLSSALISKYQKPQQFSAPTEIISANSKNIRTYQQQQHNSNYQQKMKPSVHVSSSSDMQLVKYMPFKTVDVFIPEREGTCILFYKHILSLTLIATGNGRNILYLHLTSTRAYTGGYKIHAITCIVLNLEVKVGHQSFEALHVFE